MEGKQSATWVTNTIKILNNKPKKLHGMTSVKLSDDFTRKKSGFVETIVDGLRGKLLGEISRREQLGNI